MKSLRAICWLSVSLLAIAALTAQQRSPDVPYVPTPHEVVREMLRVAQVGKDDVVYDLGCGDGRIVIAAVKDFGAKRGVGVDIDPERIRESNENAQKAGVTDRVKFLQQDLFETEVRDATVVTLYLLPSINIRLRPKLFRELRPGSRVVSHDFDMCDECEGEGSETCIKGWHPDKVLRVRGPYREHTVYYWVIPAGVAGTWRWSVQTPRGKREYVMTLRQRFQKVAGTVSVGEHESTITNAKLVGTQLSFTVTPEIGGQKVTMKFSGRVNGDTITGTVDIQGGQFPGKRDWVAKRDKVNLVGTWQWKGGAIRIEQRKGDLVAIYISDGKVTPISDFYALGAGVHFTLDLTRGEVYEGVVKDDQIVGTVNGTTRWEARRK